jgi:hypothetical protein
MALAVRIAIAIATWYPASVPALIYANWIVACLDLGRFPRPMLDDPKHVGMLTPVFHWFSVWSIFGGFYVFWAAVAFLLIALVLPKQPERKRLGLRVALSLLSVAALYGWAQLDPGSVVEWYLD